MWPHIWSIPENVPRALEKNLYAVDVGWSVQCVSVRSSGFMVLCVFSFCLFFYPL